MMSNLLGPLGHLFIFRNDSFAEGPMVATTVLALALAMDDASGLTMMCQHCINLETLPQVSNDDGRLFWAS